MSPLLRGMLDTLGARMPAFVTDHRLDVVAWNPLGAELIGGLGESGAGGTATRPVSCSWTRPPAPSTRSGRTAPPRRSAS